MAAYAHKVDDQLICKQHGSIHMAIPTRDSLVMTIDHPSNRLIDKLMSRWTSEAFSAMPTAIQQQLLWWPVAKLMLSHSSLTGFESNRRVLLMTVFLFSFS